MALLGQTKPEDILGMSQEEFKKRLDSAVTKEDFAKQAEENQKTASSLDEIKAAIAALKPTPVAEPEVDPSGEVAEDLHQEFHQGLASLAVTDPGRLAGDARAARPEPRTLFRKTRRRVGPKSLGNVSRAARPSKLLVLPRSYRYGRQTYQGGSEGRCVPFAHRNFLLRSLVYRVHESCGRHGARHGGVFQEAQYPSRKRGQNYEVTAGR